MGRWRKDDDSWIEKIPENSKLRRDRELKRQSDERIKREWEKIFEERKQAQRELDKKNRDTNALNTLRKWLKSPERKQFINTYYGLASLVGSKAIIKLLTQLGISNNDSNNVITNIIYYLAYAISVILSIIVYVLFVYRFVNYMCFFLKNHNYVYDKNFRAISSLIFFPIQFFFLFIHTIILIIFTIIIFVFSFYY